MEQDLGIMLLQAIRQETKLWVQIPNLRKCFSIPIVYEGVWRYTGTSRKWKTGRNGKGIDKQFDTLHCPEKMGMSSILYGRFNAAVIAKADG